MVALLVFIIATLEKQLFDAKGPLGDNVIKDLARYNSIRDLLIKNLLTTIHK